MQLSSHNLRAIAIIEVNDKWFHTYWNEHISLQSQPPSPPQAHMPMLILYVYVPIHVLHFVKFADMFHCIKFVSGFLRFHYVDYFAIAMETPT